MFEVGFFELAVIFGVALVVLGPTRLPGLVRSVGRWVGKARSMARQFREQLESEVNLEELNRITDLRAKEAQATTPPIPPEFSGQPLPPTPEQDAAASMAQSGYPYGAPEPAPAAEAPQPTDDTYSHAHAAGDAPMPYEPESADAPASADAAPGNDKPGASAA